MVLPIFVVQPTACVQLLVAGDAAPFRSVAYSPEVPQGLEVKDMVSCRLESMEGSFDCHEAGFALQYIRLSTFNRYCNVHHATVVLLQGVTEYVKKMIQ